MSKHIETKRKIKESEKSDFLFLLDRLMLAEEEEKMMKLHYVKRKTLSEIADELGYSEVGIAKMHQRILKKISNII